MYCKIANMRKGKFFEQIVSVIEEGLKLDGNTIVQHDIKLVDQIGVTRQIDVYITSEVNGHTIKIVVECKDHNRKVELSDIDSFDSKTKRLAIDKRIYVSKMGYQSGAITTAQKLGIELCTLSDLSLDTVKSWLLLQDFQFINQLYNFEQIRFNLDKDSKVKNVDSNFSIEGSIYLSDKKTKVSTSDILQNLVNQSGNNIPNFFEEGKTKMIVFNFPVNPYYLKYKNDYHRIDNIQCVIRFQSDIRNFPISRVQEYSQTNGKKLAQVASFEFPALSQNFIMSFVKSEKDGLARVVVARKKK